MNTTDLAQRHRAATTRHLNVRGLISLLTALSFLIMATSGLILFIVPQGRIASWVDWRFLGLAREQWGDMHISTSLLFVLAGVWHTAINWRALVGYFRDRTRKTVALKGELAVAALMTLFFTVGAVYRIPPVSYVLALNEAVKNTWIGSPADEPVVAHGELLALSVFAKKADIPLEPALVELRRQGIRVAGPDEKVLDIARNNGISPAGLYQRIEKLAGLNADVLWDEQRVIDRYDGKGIGRRTLAELCAETGIDTALAVRKLDKGGLKAGPDETLKALADRSTQAPIEVLKTVLVGEPMRK